MVIRFPIERASKTGQGPGTIVHLPQHPRALYHRANAIDDEHPGVAERLYREAVRLDPTLDLAWTNLGNLEFRKGRKRQAKVCYTKALMLCATQAEALYNLGYLFHTEGRDVLAVQYYEEALESDPGFADAWFNLGLSFRKLNRPRKAVAAFKRYLALEPTGGWAEQARRHI